MRSLTARGRVESGMNREIEMHFEQLTREFMEGGMNESEARAAARREFGPVDLVSEQCRDTRRTALIEDTAKDIAFAWRLLAKAPVFTATAVLSLALGIGANTALFDSVRQLVLRLLPIQDPESLVWLNRKSIEQDESSFSYPVFRDLQREADLPFEGFIAYSGIGRATMQTAEGAEQVRGELISGNYFELLGVRPSIGRLFTSADDERPGEHPVVVLSHGFWTRRFGATGSILNQTIRLNGHAFTVVGTGPPGFDGLDPGNPPDVYVPINMVAAIGHSPSGVNVLTANGSWWLSVLGRIRPGVSRERAGAAVLPVLLRSLRPVSTEYDKKVRASEHVRILSASQGSAGLRRRFETPLLALSALAAVVLLLTIFNVAHLLLVRASAREREISLRAALGASSFRIARLLATESLLLSALGGTLALAVAWAFSRVLLALAIPDPNRSTLNLDWDAGLLAFNFGVAALAGLFFGLAPLLHGIRRSLSSGLKGAHSGRGGRQWGRQFMIATQAGLAIVLLIGAALFVKTVQTLRATDLGYRAENVLQFSLDPAGYPHAQVQQFFDNVRERLSVLLPGVRAVAVSRQRLQSSSRWSSGISVEGYQMREGEVSPIRDAVSPGYFSALGIPLLAGREFAESDQASSEPVAIINESFARAYFGGTSPLGKRIGQGGHRPNHLIVGVVKTAMYARLTEQPTRLWYVPVRQLAADRFRAGTVSVRTAGDPAAMLGTIRAAIGSIDNGIAMFDPKTIEGQVDDQLRSQRLLAALSVYFGALAAILAGIGLFGVLAWSVARKEREIGVRLALGARPEEVAWTTVRGFVMLVALGMTAGTLGAYSITPLVQKLLFGVEKINLASVAPACLAMLVVAAIAAYLPARRAASVPPAVAFRPE